MPIWTWPDTILVHIQGGYIFIIIIVLVSLRRLLRMRDSVHWGGASLATGTMTEGRPLPTKQRLNAGAHNLAQRYYHTGNLYNLKKWQPHEGH